MTQAGYRHRIIIQDRSGSMSGILPGAQSGLEEFFGAEERLGGKVTFSVWDFDTEIRCVHSFQGADAVRGYRIEPRNATNLHGAVGMAVEGEGAKLAALPEDERPEDVTVLIASDGLHNTSGLYTAAQVRVMLEHQREVYGWRVIYMGCNQDAFAEAGNIGVAPGLTVNSAGTSTGQANAWKMSASYLSRTPVAASASAVVLDLTDDERALGESGADNE